MFQHALLNPFRPNPGRRETNCVKFSLTRRSNLEFLAIEISRADTGLAPNILNEVFLLNPESSNSLRNQQTFATGLSIQYIMGQLC